MTNAQYVKQAAKIKGLSLILPTKASTDILVIDYNKKDNRGLYPCIVDAKSWADARTQLNKHFSA